MDNAALRGLVLIKARIAELRQKGKNR